MSCRHRDTVWRLFLSTTEDLANRPPPRSEDAELFKTFCWSERRRLMFVSSRTVMLKFLGQGDTRTEESCSGSPGWEFSQLVLDLWTGRMFFFFMSDNCWMFGQNLKWVMHKDYTATVKLRNSWCLHDGLEQAKQMKSVHSSVLSSCLENRTVYFHWGTSLKSLSPPFPRVLV